MNQNAKIRSKLVALALEDLGRGDFRKARRRYVRLCGLEPDNPAHLVKLGELQHKVGSPGEAVDAWTRAATLFEAGAFDLKAVALYKRALTLQPGRADVSIALAQAHQRLDHGAEAIEVLRSVLAVLADEGRHGEALDIRLRIAKLDPSNVAARYELARDLDAAGNLHAAISEYADVIVELARIGAPDRIPKVFEGLYGLQPAEAFDSRGLLALMERSDVDSVRVRIAETLCKDSDDEVVDQTLECLLLGRAWRDAVGRVYQRVGRLHHEWRGRGSPA